MSIFYLREFVFPYEESRFPGQASDERILYVSREAPVMLYMRLSVVAIASLVVGLMGLVIALSVPGIGGAQGLLLSLGTMLLGIIFLLVGGWWILNLWKKSLFLLTNRRLTKFIYTTPWNRYNLSLGLDQIVDTGAYARGYVQALLGIGTFTARSSAGNRQEKYFYVENVHAAEDFANYVNKVLYAYNQDRNSLGSFRPFIPFLKGESRKKFMERFPQFWS